MPGELAAVRLAVEFAPEVEQVALRLAEDALPSLRSSAIENIIKKSGLVAQDVEYPVLNDANSITSGSLRFRTDGLAELSDGSVSKTMAYRKADDLFFLHEPGDRPFDLSQTFYRGFLSNPEVSPLAPLNRFGPFGVRLGADAKHGWNLLNRAQLGALNEAVPEGSLPIGLGKCRQAWLPPTGENAVVLGPTYERPAIPKLLQPVEKTVIGDRQIEWFPLGESSSVTRSDVLTVNHQMKLSGWVPDDNYTANYVRLLDRSVWRVDPEDIYKMSDRSWNEYLANGR